jgi:hypothetical protein
MGLRVNLTGGCTIYHCNAVICTKFRYNFPSSHELYGYEISTLVLGFLFVFLYHNFKQDVLGRTNCPLSFDTTRITQEIMVSNVCILRSGNVFTAVA